LGIVRFIAENSRSAVVAEKENSFHIRRPVNLIGFVDYVTCQLSMHLELRDKIPCFWASQKDGSAYKGRQPWLQQKLAAEVSLDIAIIR
jgi:hypothetical protein